jgi:Ca2+/Na+ antiporter
MEGEYVVVAEETDDGLRILFVGIVAYAALVTFLRISGKRTLSKMNAFDLVVTVALGSTLATVVLSKDVPLAEGLLALALLIALQWVVAWGSTRSQRVSELVKSEPQILYHRGAMIEAALQARARDAGRDRRGGARQRPWRTRRGRDGPARNRRQLQRDRPPPRLGAA